MSRTVRRKKFRYNYGWVLRDYEIVPDEASFRLKRITLDRHSREGRKRIARYHSDHGFGDYAHATAPRWYRRRLNRRNDRREEQALHRWRRNPDCEPVLLPRRREASWYW